MAFLCASASLLLSWTRYRTGGDDSCHISDNPRVLIRRSAYPMHHHGSESPGCRGQPGTSTCRSALIGAGDPGRRHPVLCTLSQSSGALLASERTLRRHPLLATDAAQSHSTRDPEARYWHVSSAPGTEHGASNIRQDHNIAQGRRGRGH